jgi:hypothetical protein
MPSLANERTLDLSTHPHKPNAKGVLEQVVRPELEYRGTSKHVLEPRSEDGRT